MPVPNHFPSRRALAAAAVGALLAPLPAALPAGAAPNAPSCPTARLAGSASADLIRVDVLDLPALGLAARPAAGLRIASTHAVLSTTPGKSTAAASGVDATLVGRPLTVPPTAIQQAPPAKSGSGIRMGSAPADLGVAKVGTGDLRAKAAWHDGYRCGAALGEAATSSAALVDATVLPGAGGGSLLRLPHNLNSASATGLIAREGRVATVSGTQVGLTDLRLFDGTSAAVAIKVIAEPTLSATAGGTPARSSVMYASPVLDVVLPGGRVRRLNAPGMHVDLLVSGGGSASYAGDQRTLKEDVPGLPGHPLETLFGTATGRSGQLLVRLSIGTVDKQIAGDSVRARATTLRLQLLGGATRGTLVDVGVGVLEATATAPQDLAAVPEPAPAPTGTLPITGTNVGLLVGIGILLAIAGRLLLVLSRRRPGQ